MLMYFVETFSIWLFIGFANRLWVISDWLFYRLFFDGHFFQKFILVFSLYVLFNCWLNWVVSRVAILLLSCELYKKFLVCRIDGWFLSNWLQHGSVSHVPHQFLPFFLNWFVLFSFSLFYYRTLAFCLMHWRLFRVPSDDYTIWNFSSL